MGARSPREGGAESSGDPLMESRSPPRGRTYLRLAERMQQIATDVKSKKSKKRPERKETGTGSPGRPLLRPSSAVGICDRTAESGQLCMSRNQDQETRGWTAK